MLYICNNWLHVRKVWLSSQRFCQIYNLLHNVAFKLHYWPLSEFFLLIKFTQTSCYRTDLASNQMAKFTTRNKHSFTEKKIALCNDGWLRDVSDPLFLMCETGCFISSSECYADKSNWFCLFVCLFSSMKIKSMGINKLTNTLRGKYSGCKLINTLYRKHFCLNW